MRWRILLSVIALCCCISSIANLASWLVDPPLYSLALSPWLLLIGAAYLWLEYRLPRRIFHGPRAFHAQRVARVRGSGALQTRVAEPGMIGARSFIGIFLLHTDVHPAGIVIQVTLAPPVAILADELSAITTTTLPNIEQSVVMLTHHAPQLDSPIILATTDPAFLAAIQALLPL